MTKKKIAIIVQRYGSHINGGAEVHARMVAEKLSNLYDITVLTSRAIDYHTWQPVLPEGASFENGVKVIRFDHPPKADPRKIHSLNRRIRGRKWYQKLYHFLGQPGWFLKILPIVILTPEEYKSFFTLQGPTVSKLPDYLKENKSTYTAFIFFTYLYYPTAIGMPEVANKSIFIPTIHDEPPVYFPMFKKIIPLPRWIFFNTKSEMKFSEKLFSLTNNKKEIVAVGIEKADENINKSVLDKYMITGNYLIYVGRIDSAKGCDLLIKYFIRFVEENKSDIKLVMAGKLFMKKIAHPNIIYTGFISDEDKNQLMKQALALVVPSKFESLSLVLLESFNYKVPVIVNDACEVLHDHIKDSNGGWAFKIYDEFKGALEVVLYDEHKRIIAGMNGYAYVNKHYLWGKVIPKFEHAIDDIEAYTNNR